MLELSSPLLPALPPRSLCPSSSFSTTASRQKASRSNSGTLHRNSRALHQQPDTPLSVTITSLQPSLQHLPQPQASGQASSPFSIMPGISSIPCSLTPEELHQIAHLGGNNAEQVACCADSKPAVPRHSSPAAETPHKVQILPLLLYGQL